ncbi:MAG: hypothetical protein EZS28_050550 [Streblomastix strix]|uniref:Uncharacterized protein n=1 Tax=Streblomastix strix TaxID=222440 RepID=A0A5J4T7Z3_9EUKA|nr:MAG: hypothetical protein EZS28_050550 [Streblomastix strix]
MVKVKNMRKSSHRHNRKRKSRMQMRQRKDFDVESSLRTDSSSERFTDAGHSQMSQTRLTRAPNRKTVVPRRDYKPLDLDFGETMLDQDAIDVKYRFQHGYRQSKYIFWQRNQMRIQWKPLLMPLQRYNQLQAFGDKIVRIDAQQGSNST